MPVEKKGTIANCLQCGAKFQKTPGKKDHRFCSASCRVKHWHFANCGSIVISKLQKDLTALESRVGKLEDSNSHANP